MGAFVQFPLDNGHVTAWDDNTVEAVCRLESGSTLTLKLHREGLWADMQFMQKTLFRWCPLRRIYNLADSDDLLAFSDDLSARGAQLLTILIEYGFFIPDGLEHEGLAVEELFGWLAEMGVPADLTRRLVRSCEEQDASALDVAFQEFRRLALAKLKGATLVQQLIEDEE